MVRSAEEKQHGACNAAGAALFRLVLTARADHRTTIDYFFVL
jgi:hypothetical protein